MGTPEHRGSADDFIITGKTPERLTEEVKPVVELFLRERDLERSSTTTRITPSSAGFDVLGQTLRKYDGKCLTPPSTKSVNALLGTVREPIKAHPQAKAGVMIRQLNPLMRGWANDHRHGASAPTLRNADGHSTPMVWRWARRPAPQEACERGWTAIWPTDRHSTTGAHRHELISCSCTRTAIGKSITKVGPSRSRVR